VLRVPAFFQKNKPLHLVLAVLTFSAFFINVQRFAFIGDDGFIVFRYARNLIDGNGLVFNPGERVEGYTCFLWVLGMALGMKLGIPPELLSIILGIASGLSILVTLLYLSYRFEAGMGCWIWVAPLCLSLNRTFCAWSTGGLETQLFSFLVLIALVFHVREQIKKSARPWLSSMLMGLATLTRPEGGLFFAVSAIVFSWEALVRKRRSLSALVQWLAIYAAIVGAHVLWRSEYYGFLLPNTFYAKVSGLWWEQSRHYLGLFIREHLLFLWAPLCLVFVRHHSFLIYRLFLTCVCAFTAYCIYIGGDIFEFRFMAPVLPLLYWLLQEALRRILNWFQLGSWARVIRCCAVAALIASAAFPLRKPFTPRYFINSIEMISRYAQSRSLEGKFLKELIDEGYLRKDTLIGVGGAGALPYYSMLPTLDLHGLIDPVIARSPVHLSETGARGRVGHEKIATREYVKKRGVVICDVFNRVVFEEDESLRKTLQTLENVDAPFFAGPMRCVEAKGKYLVFGTTLSEESFREYFARFTIHR
jgi:hypothetical protein